MKSMQSIEHIPEVLFRKVLFTALIGAGFLFVGIIYYIYMKDRIFLLLSGFVFSFSLFRSIGLYETAVRHKYETVEGTCVGISTKPFQKYTRIRILNQDGVETTLRIGKQSKIKIGFQYCFYFKQNERLSLGSDYLDTILVTDYLLSYEELGEFPIKDDTS